MIMFSFFVPIIVLAVVNMLRIFYIRLWICMSPFVVIIEVFKRGAIPGKW
ncbi:MAG: hypothetical protein H6765_03925 [Candidatus Peribacteria bacterium]|nr:MAG: hypothetical protein H6765_03925 [Candidatus Peribacteria bacterium]